MFKTTIRQNLSVVAMTVSGLFAFASQPAIADTTFECIEVGNSYATVALSDTGLKTEPLITWKSTAFLGSGYTPERRCHEVSKRLTGAVAQNGGLLSNLLLRTGSVNGYEVVCWVNDNQSICNSSNLLIAISPGDSVEEFLANFLNRRINACRSGVPGVPGQDIYIWRPIFVQFGEFIEHEFESNSIQNPNRRSLLERLTEMNGKVPESHRDRYSYCGYR